jgi:RNA polymerase sigma factor (sigma-70 family)
MSGGCGRGDRAQSSPPPSSRVESTRELLERARTGDRDAVDSLFARHLEPLQRWATGRLPQWARDVADTDDLVQDTLVQTFKRIDTFEPRGDGSLQAYLRQAILNRIRNELRHKVRQPDATDLKGTEIAGGESPLEQAIGREAIARYEDALRRLTTSERDAIVGRVELGYSYDELAQSLGKPTPEAARKAASRALVRLAEEMQRATG